MRLQDLVGRRLTIWNIGLEGESILRRLRHLAPHQPCTILSDTPLSAERCEFLNAHYAPLHFQSGPDAVAVLGSSDVVLKSPGTSLYRKELEQAYRQNPELQLSSATRLWFAESGAAERCIAITGSKGKSTTASLLHHCLQGLGTKSRLAGNIGIPLTDLQADDDWTVAELSSYQIADLNASPRLAVLTNLYPAHIDWHGDTERYYYDKLRLFQPGMAQRILLNHADPNTCRLLSRQQGHTHYYLHPSGFEVRNELLFYKEKHFAAAPEALCDLHNLHNICAVLSVIDILGGDCRRALELMQSYKGLPHRLQFLGRKNGVAYVDDSIAIVPEAAIAGLHHCRRRYGGPLTILLGGTRHTQSYAELARGLDAFPECLCITMGANGDEIANALRTWATENNKNSGTQRRILQSETLEEAVCLARENTPAGGVILLSPAAPSYGLFSNFIARGKAFAKAAGFDTE